MNYFDTTPNGGIPLLNDDFRFMQDNFIQAIEGLISSYADVGTNDHVIISGITRADGGATWNYSAGFVAIGGRIHVFNAVNVTKPTSGNKHVFEVENNASPDAAATRTLQDGGSANVWDIITATITTVADADARDAYDSNNRLQQVVADATLPRLNSSDLVNHIENDLDNTVDITTPLLQNGFTTPASGDDQFRVHRDKFNRISFTGTITRTGSVVTPTNMCAIGYTVYPHQVYHKDVAGTEYSFNITNLGVIQVTATGNTSVFGSAIGVAQYRNP